MDAVVHQFFKGQKMWQKMFRIEDLGVLCWQCRRVVGNFFSLGRFANQLRVRVSIFSLGVFFLQATQVLFGSEPNIESVLKKYEEGLNTIRSVRIHSSNDTSASPEHSTFAFQGGNSLYRRTTANQNMEMLCTEHLLVTVIEIFDENMRRDYQIFVDEVPLDSPEYQDVLLRSSCLYSACLFGKLQYELLGTKSIVDVLRRCTPSMTEVNIDGKRMFEMWGHKDGVTISASFILNDYATLYAFRYDIDETAKGGNFASFDYCPEDFTKYGNLLLPHIYQYNYSILTISYEYDKDMRLQPGKVTRKPSRLHREQIESIEINPDIPQSFFRISFDIPNGTPVFDRRAPHIEYIWFNGKIVPRTDEVMLAIARGGHKFMPGPDSSRFWMLAFSFLFIALGLGKMVYNIIQRNKRGGA